MRYYKILNNGYIISIGQGSGGIEISKTDYDKLMFIIQNRPLSNQNVDYLLKEDLTWESYQIENINIEETNYGNQ